MSDVITAPCADTRKNFTTQQARAALHGITVHELRDDCGEPEYVATRWAMTKAFSSVGELTGWLERVTGEVHVG